MPGSSQLPAFFEVVRHDPLPARRAADVPRDDGRTGNWFWKLWKPIGESRAILCSNGPFKTRRDAELARDEFAEQVLEAATTVEHAAQRTPVAGGAHG